MITYLVLPGILAAGYVAYQFRNVGKRDDELPPGPPTLTLLGNLHLFPKEFTHLKFTEWAKQYGEIFSLKLADNTAIILTSMESVKELMDRRSGTTVDRPENFMAERITEGRHLMLAGYTEDWRTLRRSACGVLTPTACARYNQVHHAESSQLLRDILYHPDQWHTAIRRTTSSALMSIITGRRAPRIETAELEDFVRAQHLWNHTHPPGARLFLEFTPFLNKIPDRWSPWKRLGREVRRLQRRLYLGFLVESEKRIEGKSQVGCFMEEFVERQEELGLPRELAGYLGGSLLEGGMDTTAAFLQSLVLAMVTHQDAQHKVQAELDDVVGRERAPTLDDLQNLPYVRAVLKEVHRWRPVNPLCTPHATLSDEHYKGYLIPKDATIYINNWGVLHDENMFENAESFDPERYMKNKFGVRAGAPTRDFRDNLGFGYGRRICPGMPIAQSSININAMRLLWAFNFEPAIDPKTGDPELPDLWHYTKGMVSAPEPFKCRLTPRWPSVNALIHQDFIAAATVFERYEQNLCPEDKAYALKMRAKRHTI